MKHRFFPFIALGLLIGCGSGAAGTNQDGSADSAAADGMSSTMPDAEMMSDAAVVDTAPNPGPDVVSTDTNNMQDVSITVPDASDPFMDAGALGTPAWMPVTVMTSGRCPALTPCGGDVVGTWDVAGVCVELPIAETVALCPGAMITRSDGLARGRVIFGTTPPIARRIAQWQVQVDLMVPAVCARVLGGCAGLQQTLRMAAPTTTCTMGSAGECRCTATQSSVIDDGDLYQTMNNQIVSTTSGKRWGYCITGENLRYDDRSPSGAREPGIVALTRRN